MTGYGFTKRQLGVKIKDIECPVTRADYQAFNKQFGSKIYNTRQEAEDVLNKWPAHVQGFFKVAASMTF